MKLSEVFTFPMLFDNPHDTVVDRSNFFYISGSSNKFYSIIAVTNNVTQRYRVIKIWGSNKGNSVGGLKIHSFDNSHQMTECYGDERRTRLAKDYTEYRECSEHSLIAHTFRQLRRFVEKKPITDSNMERLVADFIKTLKVDAQMMELANSLYR